MKKKRFEFALDGNIFFDCENQDEAWQELKDYLIEMNPEEVFLVNEPNQLLKALKLSTQWLEKVLPFLDDHYTDAITHGIKTNKEIIKNAT